MRRKMRSSIVVVSIALLLAMAAPAWSATTQNVTITVTIASLGVSVNPASWALGPVSSGDKVLNGSAIVIANTGNVAEDFSLVQTKAAAWTAGTTIAGTGANQYVLAARLAGAHALADFVNNDVVTTAVKPCNGVNFGAGGNNIAPGGTSDMWLLFAAPTSSTDYTEQTMTLTVGCAKH